ncbi:hypothetical protein CC86DRAFT_89586 [Ophiobolus disseminans]|uniref:Uncharacterized protein n=1 Tax=Ophiobolus disseminans TaxID=1469910 RepID=A0A6A7AIM9_9PLEO|nr:hypothetical protein CC86DRAFT_89586 [Ophiobolus disseminans]
MNCSWFGDSLRGNFTHYQPTNNHAHLLCRCATWSHQPSHRSRRATIWARQTVFIVTRGLCLVLTLGTVLEYIELSMSYPFVRMMASQVTVATSQDIPATSPCTAATTFHVSNAPANASGVYSCVISWIATTMTERLRRRIARLYFCRIRGHSGVDSMTLAWGFRSRTSPKVAFKERSNTVRR